MAGAGQDLPQAIDGVPVSIVVEPGRVHKLPSAGERHTKS
jgi:hypothetical protein